MSSLTGRTRHRSQVQKSGFFGTVVKLVLQVECHSPTWADDCYQPNETYWRDAEVSDLASLPNLY